MKDETTQPATSPPSEKPAWSKPALQHWSKPALQQFSIKMTERNNYTYGDGLNRS